MDYLDGFQYKDGNLQFFPTSEDYVRARDVSGTITYNYVYNYTDHLGNIRLSYAKDTENPNVLKILEEDHYYPFGLKHTNYNSDLLVHREYRGALVIKDPVTPEPLVPLLPYNYKYNGKEFQNEMGLNTYDYGARFYDPALARFWQIDPVAETSRRFSVYSYALNSPIYFIDRDGMFADTSENQNTGEGEQGNPPFGNPLHKSPKQSSPFGSTMQNFTSSEKTTNLFAEGKELLSNIFGYEASASAGYKGAVDLTIGPVKIEAEGTIVDASVKTSDKNLVEATVEGPMLKGGISYSDANISGSISSGSAKAVIDKKLNVKTSSEGGKITGTGSMGKNNKLSLSNSGTLAVSIKLPLPEGISGKLGGSVNFYNAGKGVVRMIQGGISYLSDYVSNWFSGD